MSQSGYSEARARVFDAAERLFMDRGYAGVTLKDVAKMLDIRQASIYYHVPNGKDELFVRVATRFLERHHRALDAALSHFEADAAASGSIPDLRAKLLVIAQWYLGLAPFSLNRFLSLDLRALEQNEAIRLRDLAYRSAIEPVARQFSEAQALEQIRPVWPDLLATLLLSALDGLHVQAADSASPDMSHLDDVLDVFLHGLVSGDGGPEQPGG